MRFVLLGDQLTDRERAVAAVIEAKLERGSSKHGILVLGSGGSNQVVATAVHTMKAKLPTSPSPIWISDPPDLDNALNMASALSFPLKTYETWGNPLSLVKALILSVAVGSHFLLPLGGNNPSGVLGQVSGALELAEQIQEGELPDCDGIYVAVGSMCTLCTLCTLCARWCVRVRTEHEIRAGSCTISGLIVGVALARKVRVCKSVGVCPRARVIEDGWLLTVNAYVLCMQHARAHASDLARARARDTCVQALAHSSRLSHPLSSVLSCPCLSPSITLLCLQLGLQAFRKEGFRLHLVPIHHLFALLSRTSGACLCVCLCKLTWSHVFECACVCMVVFVCMFVRVFVRVFVCMFVCMFVFMFVCMFVCVFVCALSICAHVFVCL